MNTESIQTLRIKARDAVMEALGKASDRMRIWNPLRHETPSGKKTWLMAVTDDDIGEVADAVLDVVVFNTIMAQIDVLLPDSNIVETARDGMEVHEQIQNSPEYMVCAELVRLADAYETLLTQHPELRD